jgi:hypothetical protein
MRYRQTIELILDGRILGTHTDIDNTGCLVPSSVVEPVVAAIYSRTQGQSRQKGAGLSYAEVKNLAVANNKTPFKIPKASAEYNAPVKREPIL